MPIAERLMTRLRQTFPDLPAGAYIKRTYAPRWQLEDGAWTWQTHGPDGMPLGIGSAETMRDLVRATAWLITTEDSDPYEISIATTADDTPPPGEEWRGAHAPRVVRFPNTPS
jgi:hypothetical protein